MQVCISVHVSTAAGLRPVRDTVQAKSLRLACKTSSLAGTRLPQRQQSLLTRQRTVTRRQTTMGLPIPIIGPLFNPFFAFVAYALGAARFWSNYNRTNFENNDNTKRKLTALWPFLFVGSPSFREGFKKTLSD